MSMQSKHVDGALRQTHVAALEGEVSVAAQAGQGREGGKEEWKS